MSSVNPIYSKQVHDFLKFIAESPLNIKPNKITEFAQSFFKGHAAEYPYEDLRRSVNLLQKEIIYATTPSNFEKEIAGAVKGLSIILAATQDPDKKRVVEETITRTKKLPITLDRYILINFALEKYPEFQEQIHNEKFKNQFGMFCSLYGNGRKKDPDIVGLLVKVWSQPNGPQLLENYAKAVIDARKKNIDLLEHNQLPTILMPHNQHAAAMLSEIIKNLADLVGDQLTKVEYDKLKLFLWDILHRTVVLNSQIHTDTLSLAFNSDYTDSLVERHKINLEAANSKNPQEGLRDYIPRANSNFYNLAHWIPPISPSEPIKTIERVIGFQTDEGLRNESTIPLNLSYLENPTIEQRHQITELLLLCDKFVTMDSSWKVISTDPRKYPIEISKKLKEMDWLSDEKKRALVQDAMVFAFKVNFELTKNLLTLS